MGESLLIKDPGCRARRQHGEAISKWSFKETHWKYPATFWVFLSLTTLVLAKAWSSAVITANKVTEKPELFNVNWNESTVIAICMSNYCPHQCWGGILKRLHQDSCSSFMVLWNTLQSQKTSGGRIHRSTFENPTFSIITILHKTVHRILEDQRPIS